MPLHSRGAVEASGEAGTGCRAALARPGCPLTAVRGFRGSGDAKLPRLRNECTASDLIMQSDA